MCGQNTWNNWSFRWLCYLACKVILISWSARPPSPVMGMALGWRKEKQWWRGHPRLLLGDLLEGLLWDLALILEGRSWDIRRPRSGVSFPGHPAPTFLAFLKARKCPSVARLMTPRPHLEHSEDLTSSGIVPLVVLKAPGVGEQVISISTTVQTGWPCDAKSVPLFCWDACTSMNTMCNDEERPSENAYHWHSWPLEFKTENKALQKNKRT